MENYLEILNHTPVLQENEVNSNLFARCIRAVDYILQDWYTDINGMWLLGKTSPEGNARIIVLTFMDRESKEGLSKSIHFTTGLNQIFDMCDIYDYHQHIERNGVFRNIDEKARLLSEIRNGELRTLYKEGEVLLH